MLFHKTFTSHVLIAAVALLFHFSAPNYYGTNAAQVCNDNVISDVDAPQPGMDFRVFQNTRELKNRVSRWLGDDAAAITEVEEEYGPISDWCFASTVLDMSNLFGGATTFNEPIGGWNVGSVTNMVAMFFLASSFNQPIGSWDVSSATQTPTMFGKATAFNQPIGEWNVAAVAGMANMFNGAASFNQPLDSWQVGNVKGVKGMFADTVVYNQPMDNWQVSKVTDMSGMFQDAVAFNQDIGQWDVSNVSNMEATFIRAESFNQNLCAWGPKMFEQDPIARDANIFRGSGCASDFDPIFDGGDTYTNFCVQECTEAGDGDGDNGDPDTCFSGSNIVEVQGKGLVPMETVQIGDLVLSGIDKNTFSRVYSFGHLVKDREAHYIQIHSDNLEIPLEISKGHIVLVNRKWTRAGDITLGDTIGVDNGVVSKIKTVKRRGIFAPSTESGTIVVSGVACSSYSALLGYGPGIQHALTHAMLAPLRVACSLHFGICENETYDEATGFSDKVLWVASGIVQLVKQSLVVQCVATILVVPFIFAAYIFEQLFLSPFLFFAAMFGTRWYLNGFPSKKKAGATIH